LPVERVEYFLPKDECVCPECGGDMHIMGKDIRRELKLIPAQAVIVEHIRHTYACRDCEHDECGVPIIKAPVDEPVIKGSFASPESIAHIMTQKFEMGVPLYRQEQEWERNGILLSRQTMSNWLLKSTEDWLVPIYDIMKEYIRVQDVLHADETTLQVLHEPGKAPQSKSYMWLYRTGNDAKIPIVLFDYQPDRRSKRPKEFLEEFKGYLHTDGYEVYHGLSEDIIIVGCLAHVRRKFVQALDAMPTENRAGSLSLIGKSYCDRLFEIERKLKDCTPKERYDEREKLARPVLLEFSAWLSRLNPMGKTATVEAIRYAQGQLKYFSNYLLDGRLEISNNRAERSIKPFVIDRKNFLFANTPRGAKSAAIIFSIIQTAKENGLNAYDYLTFVFKNAPNWDIRNNFDMLDLLLPWNHVAQRDCKKLVVEKQAV